MKKFALSYFFEGGCDEIPVNWIAFVRGDQKDNLDSLGYGEYRKSRS